MPQDRDASLACVGFRRRHVNVHKRRFKMLRLLRLTLGGLALVGIGLAVAAGCNETADRPAAGVAAKAEPKKEAIAENEVPAAVRQAIAKAFPQATCDGQEVRRSGPTTLYFIEVEEMGKSEVEAAVTPAGAIVEVETVTELKAIPTPAATAIEKAAEVRQDHGGSPG